MKKVIVLVLALLLAIGCSKKEKSVKLAPQSKLYELAKNLSAKVPALDPEKNEALVSTKYFDITVGDVLNSFQINYGDGIEKLNQMEAAQLQIIFRDNAIALAEKKLLLRAAKNAKLSISDARLDSILEMQYAQVGGKERFLTILNNMNIDFNALREDLRETLLANEYITKTLSDSMQVTDKDVEDYYRNYDRTATVRHILLKTEGKSPEEKLALYQKLDSIRNLALTGKDFAALAKKYSEDPGSKETGGLYKDFGRGEMVEQFEQAAFSVPVGQISDIFETPYGYHILKVIDRQKETAPLEKVRDKIETEVKMLKQDRVINTHLEKLKTEAEFRQIL